jgi:hypothetical protein
LALNLKQQLKMEPFLEVEEVELLIYQARSRLEVNLVIIILHRW